MTHLMDGFIPFDKIEKFSKINTDFYNSKEI
jgi:hypothetical protein